jgi:hypothetical protein
VSGRFLADEGKRGLHAQRLSGQEQLEAAAAPGPAGVNPLTVVRHEEPVFQLRAATEGVAQQKCRFAPAHRRPDADYRGAYP